MARQFCVLTDMRYDELMGVQVSYLRQAMYEWFLVTLTITVLAGCGSSKSVVEPPVEISLSSLGTAEPAAAKTLQAQIATTAVWVSTLPVASPTTEALPTVEAVDIIGTPFVLFSGTCPLPDGYIEHIRDGFCIAAPEAWAVLNIDGGLAASLKTTPGQAISLQPAWASSTAICYLTIYIAVESSAVQHLGIRYSSFTTRTDLASLSPVQMQPLAEMALPGFTWATQEGSSGGIYAGQLGPTQLVHISMGGAQCTVDNLVPILETLRFSR